jgi:hypothetical protein
LQDREDKITDRQITRIWIYLLLALVLAVALWGCIQLVNVSAAPAQTPYVCDVNRGVISVCYPYVTGYNSGYLSVVNTDTRERQAVYLNWQADHPLDMGLFKTNAIQLVLMGGGTYIIDYGYMDNGQEIVVPTEWEVFLFRLRRALAPAVLR